ncbi:MAG: protein kinase [Gemmatimonadota bacterium]|nr:protein kinase [Gemmatimonadota bacterium]
MADPIDRLNEALAGRYSIERELGEGGMATVYLARDERHDRLVAIKVLRPELSEAIGARRFLAEIKTTANLQHPHVLPLFDSGEADGLLFYVMPYVEGESLRDRLNREGSLPIEDAVRITREVADGLEHAHGAGVVHRDIKPENILLSGGHATIADFGIATAVSEAGANRLTQTGLSLGTPTYMSPEQAGGEMRPDVRSDIYGLGCVAYETLAGDPPFSGSSPRVVMARKLAEAPPPIRTVREAVPEHIERAILRAVATVPADRFASAGEFAEALGDAAGVVADATPPSAGTGRDLRRALAISIPVAAALFALFWGVRSLVDGGPGVDPSEMTLRPLTNFVGWEHSPSWSPDGSMIAYSHIVGGDADVATLSVRGGEPHILTGHSPADEMGARFSPNGSRIAYVSDRGNGSDVYVISASGGTEQKLVETHIPFFDRLAAWATSLGANAWSPDGEELAFSRLEESGDVAVWKVNLTTREETRLTTPPTAAEDGGASWAPDGGSIIFVRTQSGMRTLWQVSPEGGGETQLFDEFVMHPSWFPDGRHIAFASPRSGAFNLWALDTRDGELRQLTQGAGIDWTPAVASTGAIAYQQFGHEIEIRWAGVNDAGDEDHERLTTFTGENFGARVSPDGNQVLYYSNRAGNHDIWILDRESAQHRQLTTDPAADRLADWSPDGSEVVFMSNREGAVRLWIADAETGVTRPLTGHELPWESHEAEAQGGPRWSPDGRLIGYLAPEDGEAAVWVVEPDGLEPRPTVIRGARSFGWYLDSERIVYMRRALDGSGDLELRAAHLGTGDDVLLRSGPLAEMAMSRDGRAVSFVQSPSHFTMNLFVLRLTPPDPVDGLPRSLGEPRQVTFGVNWHVHNGGWAPDASAVVYSRDRDFADIFVLEPPPDDG